MAKEFSVKIYVEKLSKLKHSDINPRKINPKRHAALMQSLKDFPEMKQLREVVVDENLLILAGDKRTFALEELGYTDITVKKVTGLTEKQKREFIIKDNDHHGEWDGAIIAAAWDADEVKGWGVPDFKMPGADDEKKKDDTKSSHDVTCPNCQFTFDPSEE